MEFEYAITILSHFQGISLSFNSDELAELNVKNYYGDINFNALLASGLFDFIYDRSVSLQERLYPIGFINNQMLLCVGETKHIYTFTPIEPVILGNDMIDFLNNILS